MTVVTPIQDVATPTTVPDAMMETLVRLGTLVQVEGAKAVEPKHAPTGTPVPMMAALQPRVAPSPTTVPGVMMGTHAQ